MQTTETFSAIVNILRTLQDQDLLYFHQQPVRRSNGPFTMITWPNHTRGAGHYKDTAFGTYAQYRAILSEGSYHAIIYDGSLLRASYSFHNEQLTSHSLWFWPCPFAIQREDIFSFTPLDAIELYGSEWEVHTRFRTPMRFDYDQTAAADNHPAVHLHAQAHDCRIAVERPMGFAAFIQFIFRNFYANDWHANQALWPAIVHHLNEQDQACLTLHDMHSLHFGWKID